MLCHSWNLSEFEFDPDVIDLVEDEDSDTEMESEFGSSVFDDSDDSDSEDEVEVKRDSDYITPDDDDYYTIICGVKRAKYIDV